MMDFDYRSRRQRLTAALERAKVDALVITHLPNVRYLCGFTGSTGLLVVTPKRWVFITDGRYTEQARAEVVGARVSTVKGVAAVAAAKLISRAGWKRVGVEADHLSVSSRNSIAALLAKGVRLVDTSCVVESLRMIKDAGELERIRRAVFMGAVVLPTALETITPGTAENVVAAEIEYSARRKGAEAMSFETIVAAGERSALPHGRASSVPIPRSGFVVLDFGVILAGYCSDMTRTVHVGRASRDSRRIYDAVLDAQLAAIDAVRPGVTASSVDRAARKVLDKAGLGEYFTHSTGHGVGLEIHERPRLGKGSDELLQPGMVITIEPGAYVPGRGGVRIEDIVFVTEDGCEVVTPADKSFVEL